MPKRSLLPTLNRRHNLKHIAIDLNLGGSKDSEVYELAVRLKRLLVTFNEKDFIEYAAESRKIGIIGVSQTMSLDQIDKRLLALLTQYTHKQLCGKMTSVHA